MSHRLHHIALGARDVDKLATFYAVAFELTERVRHYYDDGQLRSVWLEMGDTILMVEHTYQTKRRVEGVGAGPFLLAFAVADAHELSALERRVERLGAEIEDRTDFSSYFRDPEGNRVAASHYVS